MPKRVASAAVDPSTADVLRVEGKKVLMFSHEACVEALNKVFDAYTTTITA